MIREKLNVEKHECRIYIILNNINNKVYIGQTWNTIYQRFRRHCEGADKESLIYKAIKKYGAENFSIKELVLCYNQNDADKFEVGFIREYKSFRHGQQFGYNLTAGGGGFRKFNAWKEENPHIKCKICGGEINYNANSDNFINFCGRKCYSIDYAKK